jgi:hypothetical protein
MNAPGIATVTSRLQSLNHTSQSQYERTRRPGPVILTRARFRDIAADRSR